MLIENGRISTTSGKAGGERDGHSSLKPRSVAGRSVCANRSGRSVTTRRLRDHAHPRRPSNWLGVHRAYTSCTLVRQLIRYRYIPESVGAWTLAKRRALKVLVWRHLRKPGYGNQGQHQVHGCVFIEGGAEGSAAEAVPWGRYGEADVAAKYLRTVAWNSVFIIPPEAERRATFLSLSSHMTSVKPKHLDPVTFRLPAVHAHVRAIARRHQSPDLRQSWSRMGQE